MKQSNTFENLIDNQLFKIKEADENYNDIFDYNSNRIDFKIDMERIKKIKRTNSLNKNTMYYILTEEKKKKLLITKNLDEISDFILENRSTKIFTIDHTRKVRRQDKRLFLMDYYNHLEIKDRFFQMAEIMVKGANNKRDLFTLLGLKQDYKQYKKNFEINL